MEDWNVQKQNWFQIGSDEMFCLNFTGKCSVPLCILLRLLCISIIIKHIYDCSSSFPSTSFKSGEVYYQVWEDFKGQVDCHLPVLWEDLLITFSQTTSERARIAVEEIGTCFIWAEATLTSHTFHFLSQWQLRREWIQSMPLTQRNRFHHWRQWACERANTLKWSCCFLTLLYPIAPRTSITQ